MTRTGVGLLIGLIFIYGISGVPHRGSGHDDRGGPFGGSFGGHHGGGGGPFGGPSGGRHGGKGGAMKQNAMSCAEALKEIDVCCDIPQFFPASTVDECHSMSQHQLPETPWGGVGGGRPFDQWDWDDWVHGCSKGLDWGPDDWDDDDDWYGADDDDDDDDYDYEMEDYETNEGRKGKKPGAQKGKSGKGDKMVARKKSGNVKAPAAKKGHKGGKSGRMGSDEGRQGPWSFGRECFDSCVFSKNNLFMADRSLRMDDVKAIFTKGLSASWAPIVEKAFHNCSTGLEHVDILDFDEPARLMGMRCGIAASMFNGCIRRYLALRCPDEAKGKAGSSCPNRLAKAQLCKPFAMPQNSMSNDGGGGWGRGGRNRGRGGGDCGGCGGGRGGGYHGSSSEEGGGDVNVVNINFGAPSMDYPVDSGDYEVGIAGQQGKKGGASKKTGNKPGAKQQNKPTTKPQSKQNKAAPTSKPQNKGAQASKAGQKKPSAGKQQKPVG